MRRQAREAQLSAWVVWNAGVPMVVPVARRSSDAWCTPRRLAAEAVAAQSSE
jgi:hypothetical protein